MMGIVVIDDIWRMCRGWNDFSQGTPAEDSLQANHDRDENLINGATEVIPPFEGGQISIKPK
jgi:hypothetical protein